MEPMIFDEIDVRVRLRQAQIPEHMHEGVVRFLVEHRRPGSFLTALLSNDLVRAFGHADDVNIYSMREWASWLYNHLPSQRATGSPWGSPAAVEAWVTSSSASQQDQLPDTEREPPL